MPQKLRHVWFFEFVIQLVLSTLGAMLAGITLGLVLSILTAAFTKNTSGGNFVDHVIDQRVFRVLSDNPYFLGPILVAFISGVILYRFWATRVALTVWVLPAAILLWNIWTWKSYSPRSDLADAWANYFGSDCGGTECTYELFVTAPFLTSSAFSLGWVIRRIFDKLPADVGHWK